MLINLLNFQFTVPYFSTVINQQYQKNVLAYICMYLLTINSVEERAMLFYRNEIGELYDDILVGKVFRIE